MPGTVLYPIESKLLCALCLRRLRLYVGDRLHTNAIIRNLSPHRSSSPREALEAVPVAFKNVGRVSNRQNKI